MSGKGGSRGTEESYTNTNFWGLDGYKNTVKRVDDGAYLCDEFTKMVNERAEIEMKYTLKLRDWSKRWNEKINGKISEYGTLLEAFRATLREAEDVAEIHVERYGRLKNDLCESIKQWKNQHYHKSVLKWKEVKECETGFSKIHDPWARKYHKMDKAKKNFHRASKNSENAAALASNAERDGVPDKVKKLQDNSTKLKGEMDDARKKYERRLSEMNSCNATYADELEEEFKKWERFEKVRLTFFRDVLQRYHSVLDISNNERLVDIYKTLLNKTIVADAAKDLKWWSTQYGPGMVKKWPEFEEYDPNRPPNAKNQLTVTDAVDADLDNGIDDPSHDNAGDKRETGSSYNPFDEDDDADENKELLAEMDKVNGQVPENTAPANGEDVLGIPVRAKYDYTASEGDELSFRCGDIITQMSEEDTQGWCRGKLNGVEGLFPAKWVESVEI